MPHFTFRVAQPLLQSDVSCIWLAILPLHRTFLPALFYALLPKDMYVIFCISLTHFHGIPYSVGV
jgi:hypothetical protein